MNVTVAIAFKFQSISNCLFTDGLPKARSFGKSSCNFFGSLLFLLQLSFYNFHVSVTEFPLLASIIFFLRLLNLEVDSRAFVSLNCAVGNLKVEQKPLLQQKIYLSTMVLPYGRPNNCPWPIGMTKAVSRYKYLVRNFLIYHFETELWEFWVKLS